MTLIQLDMSPCISWAVFSWIVMRESRSATLSLTLALGFLYTGVWGGEAATPCEVEKRKAEAAAAVKSFIVNRQFNRVAQLSWKQESRWIERAVTSDRPLHPSSLYPLIWI